MTLPPSATSPPKLPFWRTVGACYATVFGNFGQLLRISWLWLLVMLPIYAVAQWIISPLPAYKMDGFLISMLPSVLELPALASIAVAWHRLVLRQEGMQGAAYLRLDRVVWWYGAILLGFLVVTVGPMTAALAAALPGYSNPSNAILIPTLQVFAGIATGLGIGIFVLPRLSLVLPAKALGERLTFGEAWRATRGNTWRLVWASMLCSVPPLIPFSVLLWYVEGGGPTVLVVGGTVHSLAYVLIVTIAVTLLSLAYRHFIEQRRGAEPAA